LLPEVKTSPQQQMLEFSLKQLVGNEKGGFVNQKRFFKKKKKKKV
jgi:hypothetical protein